MKKQLAKLELEKVLESDAKEIIEARKKAILIHHSKNIDAAGDEVEKTVRKVIKRKLPKSYYLGHGHIVDNHLNTSSQIDIIIADNNNVPILFKTKNRTEYFPYESVHAIGEVKTTFKKQDVNKFVKTCKEIKSDLFRQKTPRNYLGNEITLGSEFSVNIETPYRNPLFTFMIFADSGTFKPGQLLEVYSDNNINDLPNILLLLDKGCLVNAEILKKENKFEIGSINLIPEFIPEEKQQLCEWVFLSFGDSKKGNLGYGNNLGFFYFFLSEHLIQSVLMNTNLHKYLSQFFTVGEGKIIKNNQDFHLAGNKDSKRKSLEIYVNKKLNLKS